MTAHRQQLVAYADVGTYGLAHSLLAWGRCRVWCTVHGVPMLAPNWLHIQHRLGPLRRRERDKRQYHLLFHFPGYVRGLRRAWILATATRLPAETTDLQALLCGVQSGLVVFKNRTVLNEEIHFHEVHGHGPQLRKDLSAITKPQYLPAQEHPAHVALHVRMGDFSAEPSIEALRQGAKNSRIPLNWYMRMLTALRREIGPIPARLYSDGSDADLAELLALPDVVRPPKQPSVTDLLSIAQAALVISSGSGFSMWGSFLGDAPRICFPGQRFARVLTQHQGLEREPEAEHAAELPTAFLDQIAERLLR